MKNNFSSPITNIINEYIKYRFNELKDYLDHSKNLKNYEEDAKIEEDL